MARIIAVANQKGGVGKTTTAINLGTALALARRRVLLVDLDPQGNLTSGLGLRDGRIAGRSLYDVLVTPDEVGRALDVVSATRVEALSVIPADERLIGAEIELVPLDRREQRLRDILDPIRDEFDEVLIDCPPSLGLLTLNALVAADAVLIPLHCEYFALEGLAALVSTMRRVRANLNTKLDIEGVLLTMYDDRTNLGQQVAGNIRDFFKEKVFTTVIPRNVRLGEAPSHGLPVMLYDARSRGSDAYNALAREFLDRRRLTPSHAAGRPDAGETRGNNGGETSGPR